VRLSRLMVVLLAACGVPPASEPQEQLAQPIVGGTVNTGDPAVFLLLSQAPNAPGVSICTATLIDSRTLLTAAHCVDDLSATVQASNAATIDGRNSSNVWRVVDRRIHPMWRGTAANSFFGDIAVVRLNAAPPVTPKPWNTANLQPFIGRAVRSVGYGITGPSSSNSSGIKRQVELTLRSVQQFNLFIGNMNNKGICQGDSGGPTFMTFPDGVERVIGVHSYTAGTECTYGAASVTSYYAPQIQAWLAEWESPTCNEDGRCVMNCPQVDLDCVCGRDNQCTAACPDLSRDPDCPANCGTDGICAQGVCPVPDRDCVARGSTCARPDQCASRQCIVDPQNPLPYCSEPCASGGCTGGYQCDGARNVCTKPQLPVVSPGMRCTPGANFCSGGNACTGVFRGEEKCSSVCSSDANCPAGWKCETGLDGIKFCREPPPPPPPILIASAANAQGVEVKGCAVAGWPLVLMVLARPRRRRA
jgi:hypothetical protein